MSDKDIKEMQDKIDESIRLTHEKLVEKVRRGEAELIVNRDGEIKTLTACEV